MIQQIESGGNACDLGITRTWQRVNVSRLSYHGKQNGLLVGDRIVDLNGAEFNSDSGVHLLSKLNAGSKFSLRVFRVMGCDANGTPTDQEHYWNTTT